MVEAGAKAELINAKEGDVVAFDSGSPEFHMYDLTYYHSYGGNLKDYHAILAGETEYSEGFFRWKDDTTIVMKLIDSKTDSSKTFELFGNGSSSGMTIED